MVGRHVADSAMISADERECPIWSPFFSNPACEHVRPCFRPVKSQFVHKKYLTQAKSNKNGIFLGKKRSDAVNLYSKEVLYMGLALSRYA